MRILASVLFCTSLAACAMATDETTGTAESAFTAVSVTNYPAWGQLRYSESYDHDWCLAERSVTDDSLTSKACDINDPLQYFQFTPDPNYPASSGVNWIRGWHNGCVDNVRGEGILYQAACSTSANAEGWWFNPLGQLVNSGNHQCLGQYSVRAAKGVGLFDCTDGTNADGSRSVGSWSFVVPAAHVNRYAFLGMKNRCLDHGPYQPFAAGLPLVTWDCNGGLAQMFQWNPFNHGEIKDLATGLCLDTLWVSSNGAPIVEMPCSGVVTQAFTVASGQVVSNWNQKCLEVRGWSESNGTTVEQWDCWGGLLQHWDHVQ